MTERMSSSTDDRMSCSTDDIEQPPEVKVPTLLDLPAEQPPEVKVPTLLDLPAEIIYDIFDLLDPLFLSSTVTLVCKKFNKMLSHDNSMWKRRYVQTRDPVLSAEDPYLNHIGVFSSEWKTGESITWRDLCVGLQRSANMFMQPVAPMSFLVEGTSVDVVRCVQGRNGYCLAGTRERSIRVWDWELLRETFHITNAHNGWMSCLNTWGENIVSAAWDGEVKIWSFNEYMEPLNSFTMDLAIMALSCQDNMIAACTFPNLYLMDPRISRDSGLCRYSMPEGSLVQINFWRNSLIVASRNKKLINFDVRMCRPVECVEILTTSSPRTMAISDDIVYVGDNSGKVYLYDPYSNFKVIDEYFVRAAKSQIRALMPRPGQIMVGTSDGIFEAITSVQKSMYTPSAIGMTIFHGEITAGHYNEGVVSLAVQNHGDVMVYVFYG